MTKNTFVTLLSVWVIAMLHTNCPSVYDTSIQLVEKYDTLSDKKTPTEVSNHCIYDLFRYWDQL